MGRMVQALTVVLRQATAPLRFACAEPVGLERKRRRRRRQGALCSYGISRALSFSNRQVGQQPCNGAWHESGCRDRARML